ncbi:hypothetical protein DFA_05263 [Cavenderia fasciculata]|uniref:Uncharacterized protein n=1 Tax=Cavenderia fasciculata TaxID=261658 RepID=F4PNT0_CACFS|nr:uncharacterized protein DFA_05263 [Cavenderia fasciculata]EGG23133.1 hypothetical protein DFA_05263 [Cavenderia fasciculata]|eukprot:XP_004360984.1 hypothetical protein DFA_05263 [Cavenderia fasciculata]
MKEELVSLPPPTSFIELIVKLSKEREINNQQRKQLDEKTIINLIHKIKSKEQQEYNRLIVQQWDQTLSWLFYLIVHSELPTIRNESIYLLDYSLMFSKGLHQRSLRVNFKGEYNQIDISPLDIFNQFHNDHNDYQLPSQVKDMIISILNSLLTKYTSPKGENDKLIQTLRDISMGDQSITRSSTLTLIERICSGLQIHCPSFIFLEGYLKDNNVELRHRAINIIYNATTTSPSSTSSSTEFNYSSFFQNLWKAGYTIKKNCLDVDEMIIKHLESHLLSFSSKRSLFGRELEDSKHIIKSMDPSNFKKFSNILLPIILDKIIESLNQSSLLEYFMFIGSIVGLKYFNVYLGKMLGKCYELLASNIGMSEIGLFQAAQDHFLYYIQVLLVDCKKTPLNCLGYKLRHVIQGVSKYQGYTLDMNGTKTLFDYCQQLDQKLYLQWKQIGKEEEQVDDDDEYEYDSLESKMVDLVMAIGDNFSIIQAIISMNKEMEIVAKTLLSKNHSILAELFDINQLKVDTIVSIESIRQLYPTFIPIFLKNYYTIPYFLPTYILPFWKIIIEIVNQSKIDDDYKSDAQEIHRLVHESILDQIHIYDQSFEELFSLNPIISNNLFDQYD